MSEKRKSFLDKIKKTFSRKQKRKKIDVELINKRYSELLSHHTFVFDFEDVTDATKKAISLPEPFIKQRDIYDIGVLMVYEPKVEWLCTYVLKKRTSSITLFKVNTSIFSSYPKYIFERLCVALNVKYLYTQIPTIDIWKKLGFIIVQLSRYVGTTQYVCMVNAAYMESPFVIDDMGVKSRIGIDVQEGHVVSIGPLHELAGVTVHSFCGADDPCGEIKIDAFNRWFYVFTRSVDPNKYFTIPMDQYESLSSLRDVV